MEIDNTLGAFFAEATEILESMESILLGLDEGSKDGETINNETVNELFRAAHTIKGSAGMFRLVEIVGFTHMVENVLDMVRCERVPFNAKLINILFSCRDHIAKLVSNAKQQLTSDTACLAQGDRLQAALREWLMAELGTFDVEDLQSALSIAGTRSNTDITPTELSADTINLNPVGLWCISARFGKDLLRNGMDPISIIRFLNTLGTITQIAIITDEFPSLSEFDPEQLYLGFDIVIQSDARLDAIENAFMFVREESAITIIPPRSNIQAYIDLINATPKSRRKLGEILVATHVISQHDLIAALDIQLQQAKDQNPVSLLGEILMDSQELEPNLITAALDRQQNKTVSRTTIQETRFIRIEAKRLDTLINLIGELVVNRQNVDLLAAKLGSNALIEAVNSMGHFTEQIRDAALMLRMVAIGDTFLRFKRVVRDTAIELGKEIQLEIEGAETELDRSMVEKLNDPLMHIIRNAIDHGIESKAVRITRNKPLQGTIALSARHDAGSIVIDITDDGGGLDLARIRKKAIEKGLIDEGHALSRQELCMLIFHPGLSTAEAVTSLSGRGVGMDVVKSNIESLRGAIEIETELGVGTGISIRLPLTLAIIDGFHVAAGNIDFIVPQNTILECVDLGSLNYISGQHYVNLRDQQVPFIRLQELFELEKQKNTREKMVVVQFGERRAGIVVDSLYGEIQTVVKPMGPIFQALKGIGGSSLLGTGAVALIVDVQQLIHFAMTKENALHSLECRNNS